MTQPAAGVPGLPFPTAGSLVVMSTLLVPVTGADALEQAFRARLGAVDSWQGHRGLQVWRDLHAPGRYAMTSWWDDRATFARYMASADHRASHHRIPRGDHAPVLESLHRYQVVST
jgi:heme-degrading monooxygenase HmoA